MGPRWRPQPVPALAAGAGGAGTLARCLSGAAAGVHLRLPGTPGTGGGGGGERPRRPCGSPEIAGPVTVAGVGPGPGWARQRARARPAQSRCRSWSCTVAPGVGGTGSPGALKGEASSGPGAEGVAWQPARPGPARGASGTGGFDGAAAAAHGPCTPGPAGGRGGAMGAAGALGWLLLLQAVHRAAGERGGSGVRVSGGPGAAQELGCPGR